MKRAGWLILAVAVAIAASRWCGGARDPDAIRIATFNIENFPKDARQVAGAFEQIAALGASVVAVQEISDPARFAREARARLGERWRFVHVDTRPIAAAGPGRHRSHHIGVVFDTRAWTLVSTRAHDDTRDGGRHKPTFEARLRPAGGGEVIRILVVHLKSGGDHVDLRGRQLAGLRAVIAKSGERTVVLGDFNATGDRDRANLAALASATRLAWATEPLACSAFWSRDDGCFRSRLDHVLSWRAPVRVEAAGGCATHGCEWEASCPTYAEHVSDHCPVVVTYEP